jgi:hypothetical protein
MRPSLSLESTLSAVLTIRISDIEKAAIERAAVSGRAQSSLAAAAIGRYMRDA